MTDTPQFIEDAGDAVPVIVSAPRTPLRNAPVVLPNADARSRSFIATLDFPLIIITAALLGLGAIMVYSTTFNWSFEDFGSDTFILMRHFRNMAIGTALLVVLTVLDYRFWRRFAVLLLLLTISVLIGVLIFGDNTFGATRALIAGSYQPGELAELVMVLYMAAWMGSKSTRVSSFLGGLLPFMILVGIVAGLIFLQPDLSTGAIVVVTCGVMFFLAGASLRQLVVAAVLLTTIGIFVASTLPYAQERLETFQPVITDPQEISYHVLQAMIAFREGGWFGRGIGEGLQKFGALPAPHTDSVFAVIGEELGLFGVLLVLGLYLAFAVRGFQIAQRAKEPFGALLVAGLTVWVVAQALLNIAVMTGAVPPTGVPLPFISYGGSSMTVLMSGVGLMLSVHRVTQRQEDEPERRKDAAPIDRSRRDGRTRLPRPRGE